LRKYQFVTMTEAKARQSAKIRELRGALIEAGLLTIDQQAKALGLSRSTTWTILKANHKASGLSASIINRMLASPQLPPLVRAKVLEYIAERAAGLHGHNKMRCCPNPPFAELIRLKARSTEHEPRRAQL
jgi:predicted DNA-binding transcriptional regulator AlpA